MQAVKPVTLKFWRSHSCSMSEMRWRPACLQGIISIFSLGQHRWSRGQMSSTSLVSICWTLTLFFLLVFDAKVVSVLFIFSLSQLATLTGVPRSINSELLSNFKWCLSSFASLSCPALGFDACLIFVVFGASWLHSRKKAGSRDPGSRTFFGPN